MKLRTLLLCLVTAIALTLCALADSGGKCGKNLTWQSFDDNGLLVIFGEGEMDNAGTSFDPLEDFQGIVTVDILDGVTSIGDSAFISCSNLANITIPDSVTYIGHHAFFLCDNLTSVIIPDSVTEMGMSVFSYCESLTDITLSNSLTSIDSLAFSDCKSLKNITIPDGVTSIGDYAFHRCSNLKSVIIPNSVTFIGQCAFDGCENLTDVHYGGSVTQWSEIHISNYENGNDALKNATIYHNAQDVGVGITLTDENGDTVDATGHTGETEETKKDVFQDGAEFTASFTAADLNAVTSSGLVTANVFLIFYDKDGLMVSLESREINLSDPLSLMFVLQLRIPEGAKTLKFLMLGDNLEPLRAQRLIESSAA